MCFGLEVIVAIPSANAPDIPVAETPVPEPRIPARPQTTPPAAAAPDPSADLPSPVPGDRTTRSARDALRPGRS